MIIWTLLTLTIQRSGKYSNSTQRKLSIMPENAKNSTSYQRPDHNEPIGDTLKRGSASKRGGLRRRVSQSIQSTSGVAQASQDESMNKKRPRSRVEAEEQVYEAEKIIGHRERDDVRTSSFEILSD